MSTADPGSPSVVIVVGGSSGSKRKIFFYPEADWEHCRSCSPRLGIAPRNTRIGEREGEQRQEFDIVSLFAFRAPPHPTSHPLAGTPVVQRWLTPSLRTRAAKCGGCSISRSSATVRHCRRRFEMVVDSTMLRCRSVRSSACIDALQPVLVSSRQAGNLLLPLPLRPEE